MRFPAICYQLFLQFSINLRVKQISHRQKRRKSINSHSKFSCKMYVKVCKQKISYGTIGLVIAIYSIVSLFGHFYFKIENMLLTSSCKKEIDLVCVDDLLGFVVFASGLMMAIFLGIASVTV